MPNISMLTVMAPVMGKFSASNQADDAFNDLHRDRIWGVVRIRHEERDKAGPSFQDVNSEGWKKEGAGRGREWGGREKERKEGGGAALAVVCCSRQQTSGN